MICTSHQHYEVPETIRQRIGTNPSKNYFSSRFIGAETVRHQNVDQPRTLEQSRHSELRPHDSCHIPKDLVQRVREHSSSFIRERI